MKSLDVPWGNIGKAAKVTLQVIFGIMLARTVPVFHVNENNLHIIYQEELDLKEDLKKLGVL